MAADAQPIIKKIRKVHGHAHHGGAWKIAYADFVTAMMAFFLLMWLVNITTEEQKLGIANYFLPTTYAKGDAGSTGVSGGAAVEQDGPLNMTPMTRPGIVTGLPPDDGDGTGRTGDDFADMAEIDMAELDARQREALREDEEQREFERIRDQLRDALENNPALADLGKNLKIDRTPEGVRIQILDQDQRSMFPLGSAVMYPHMKELGRQIVGVIRGTDRRISITGHTDATPFRATSGLDNWQLSADRANAARRALLESGLDEARVARVAGKAATEPLDLDDPSAPTNRRISIVLLNEGPPPPG